MDFIWSFLEKALKVGREKLSNRSHSKCSANIRVSGVFIATKDKMEDFIPSRSPISDMILDHPVGHADLSEN